MLRNLASLVLVCGMLSAIGCASTQEVSADALNFHASTSWVRVTPPHETRRLQFAVPSNDPAFEDAKLIVWNFAEMRDKGDGDVVRRNMDRWCEQFTQADGTSTYDVAEQSEYIINGIPVRTIDISGRYVEETSPGSGINVDKPYYRMIGAYIAAQDGDYLVKFVGPSSVVSANAGEFRTFLHSMRAAQILQQDSWQKAHRRTELTATRSSR